MIYYEEFSKKEEAMHREWEIKQLSRKEKEKLVINFRLQKQGLRLFCQQC